MSSNFNNSGELNVSKAQIVAVPSNAVKYDTRSPQESLASSTLTEPFDLANYSNNTLTKSSLSSSTSYLSILEKKEKLEHAALETKLAEEQAKRKLEFLLKILFITINKKIENEAIIEKEKVALINFEQNLPNVSQSSSSKYSTKSVEISVKSSPIR